MPAVVSRTVVYLYEYEDGRIEVGPRRWSKMHRSVRIWMREGNEWKLIKEHRSLADKED